MELVSKRLPKYYGVRPDTIQVLTPMQRGVVGATNLNQALQAAVNPAKGPDKWGNTDAEMHRGGYTYRAGDKVMQIRNNYDKEVFNGDIGTINNIDSVERMLQIQFDDRSVDYDVTELDEIVLAYATTVHKAQGAEYPIVVMPVMMTHFVMLQRNLLYTGITRAKKALVLVGTKKAIAYAVRNVTVDKRNTLLTERLGGTRQPDRYVVFDVETPNHYNDRMSAIGITVIKDGVIANEFFSFVNPEEPFDEFNTELTGISAATVADAPTFRELWSRIEPIMASGVLVAHNAAFDLGVLKSCLKAYGISWKEKVSYLCTVKIGRKMLPDMRHNLDVMCNHYDIELDHHKADSDSHACAEILFKYMEEGAQVERFLQKYRIR